MSRVLLRLVGIGGAAILAALIVFILADIREMQSQVAYVRPQSPAAPEENLSQEEPSSAPEAAIVSETQPAAAAQSQESTRPNEVRRIKTPYATDPKTDAELYTLSRAALVNIYCTSKSRFGSISGSGVVIDPKGVILTNAHVAQYILLVPNAETKTQCFIRTGSPSQNKYTAELLFLPSPWIAEHAADIATKRPMGTGEHDYALLRITGTIDGTALPTAFPHIPIDTREAIAFSGDRLLLAAYPAEFAIQGSRGTTLYPTSVFTYVGELMTFGERSVDLISLGGAVLAQSGSSGGAVVNLWGQLVGIISTTSAGNTTAERELRAITLFYINRDLEIQTGLPLSSFLTSDLAARSSLFMKTTAPTLASKLLENL